MILIGSIVGAALVCAAGGVYAGLRVEEQVTVTDNHAQGSLASARNSTDGFQYIGCWSAGWSGTQYTWCEARGADGTWGACLSYDKDIAAAAQSTNGDSWLSFWWDPDGTCYLVQTANASHYGPKQP
jgi:hypothetical protein